jgi:hypothetical protein
VWRKWPHTFGRVKLTVKRSGDLHNLPGFLLEGNRHTEFPSHAKWIRTSLDTCKTKTQTLQISRINGVGPRKAFENAKKSLHYRCILTRWRPWLSFLRVSLLNPPAADFLICTLTPPCQPSGVLLSSLLYTPAKMRQGAVKPLAKVTQLGKESSFSCHGLAIKCVPNNILVLKEAWSPAVERWLGHVGLTSLAFESIDDFTAKWATGRRGPFARGGWCLWRTCLVSASYLLQRELPCSFLCSSPWLSASAFTKPETREPSSGRGRRPPAPWAAISLSSSILVFSYIRARWINCMWEGLGQERTGHLRGT